MEFRDLKQQYQLHKAKIDSAVQQVLDDTNFISGKEVKELEKKLAEYVGVKHCITCANGTDALQLALMTWDIGPGDAVFVPDFTFFSSGEVVSLVGATPVFVAVEKDTYNMSPQYLEDAIEQVLHETDLIPKVVVAVDLFGQPADYLAIRKITNKYQMYLLEDGAQGFGGSIGQEKACSFGDISTTSFFPAKPLGCYGDGGAIFTDNDEWAKLLRSLCVHGKGTDKYDNIRIGMNSRLDTVQAAIVAQKLDFFDWEVEQCNMVASEYTKKLKDIVVTPKIAEEMCSSWAQYTIRLQSEEKRDALIETLKENSIPSAVYYKRPMHQQKAFVDKCIISKLCVETESLCTTCLSLPMHAYLKIEEIEKICRVIKDYLQK